MCNCAIFLNNSFLSFPVNFLSFPAHFLPQTISDIALLSSPGDMGAERALIRICSHCFGDSTGCFFLCNTRVRPTVVQTDALHHRDSPHFPAAQLRGKFCLCQDARQTARKAHLGERDQERKGVSKRNLSSLCVCTSSPEESLIKADTLKAEDNSRICEVR